MIDMSNFTHWNDEGRPKMVDITEKVETTRTAVAQSTIVFKNELYEAIQNQQIKKGDPLQVAQIAGIMAAKKTSELIPMCHPIQIKGVDFTFEYVEGEVDQRQLIIQASVRCNGSTGVEMEALTAVSVAALTFYDMCKAIDKSICIKETLLISKTGGKNGDYHFSK
jgi:cyclic pyranopterin phosphate synthase